MDWKVYEQKLVQELQDAEHNLEYFKDKYREAAIEVKKIYRAKQNFEREMERMMGK